jgi:hypothetical protein
MPDREKQKIKALTQINAVLFGAIAPYGAAQGPE